MQLSELEQRVLEAEARAEEAEDKVRMMEQQLAQADWAPGEAEEHAQAGSGRKDTAITKLETQVEEQRQLRLQDAKQVEAKAAKIKEWVTNKLRELEEQNQHLREQNQKCNAQLELLRNHLAQSALGLGLSRDHRSSTAGSSSRASLSLEVTTASDDSLGIAPLELPTRPLSTVSSSLRHCSDGALLDSQEPLYAEVERRAQPAASAAAKFSGSDVHMLDEELQAAVEGLALLPSVSPLCDTGTGTADEAVHDYAEIYTPSRERAPWLDDGQGRRDVSQGGSTSSTTSGSTDACRPPTPPLHRFPSWESRIYQVAAGGLQADGTTGHTSAGHQSAGGYCDISVPVYATVKGRASQIRSVPFTGDSSDDSSDGEGGDGAGHSTRATNSSSGDTDTSLSSPSKSLKTTSSLSPAKRSSSGSPSKSMKRAEVHSTELAMPTDTSFESGMSDDYAIPPDAMSGDSSADSSLAGLLHHHHHHHHHRSSTACTDGGAVSAANATTPRPPGTVPATGTRTESSLEKCGHLAKLGGKLKTWRKRWFLLRNGVLTYWKSQNDVNRKPQGQIVLDEVCRITRAEGAATFEISTGKKTYYLTADSIATMEDWIRVLQNVQRRNATKLLLGREDQKPTVQGWLTKVKNGHAKRCWCVLIGKMFLYFKSPGDTNPMGQINMRDARVEEVDHVSDSDSEDRDPDGQPGPSDLTVGIFPSHQGPTYLLVPSKQEKDQWMYHLTVVSGGGPSAGTQYEQLVQKLMETDGDPNCVLWRHPHLLHSKECIASPLTTLSSETIQAEAIKLFKSCQLFISVALDSAGIDYHVVLAQNALQQCLDMPELQSELICALVKQTSRHTHHRLGVQVNRAANKLKHSRLLLCATQSLFACDTSSSSGGSGAGGSGSGTGAGGAGGGRGGGSPTSLQATPPPAPVLLDCKTNPPTFVFVQGWQLLALAVSLFVPRNNRLLWFLKCHLHRSSDTKTECGKYAAYCQRALERTLQNGGREAKPSRMEVLSILLKNPYHHSLPHAIPVHMLNGTYQVVSFDGSTTIEEFVGTLNQEIGCRDVAHSGFTLFSDDPIEKDLEHYVDLQAKLCDVISKWETALREKGSGKFENTRVIRLTYKNRLYWRSQARTETEKERLLLCYQVNLQAVQGRFPLSRELALELAALMAQIDYGEYNSDKTRGSGGVGGAGSGNLQQVVSQALDRFYPYRYRDGLSPDELKELQDVLAEKWSSLRGRTVLDCVRIYLTCTRKWSLFGASLFQARLRAPVPLPPESTTAAMPEVGAPLWIAAAEDGVSLLELSTMSPLVKYPYAQVVTFGGCQDDFMLVVGSDESGGGASQKMLFALSKPKILELTLLIADYMNAMGHTLPGTPQMGTLTRNGSHRSVRGRGAAQQQSQAAPPAPGGTGGATVSTLQSQVTTSTGAGSSTGGHGSASGSGPQPDILKSTPDHQQTPERLHRTDSKKRAHLDSGVA
ncbi:uncharacterized protein CG43867 [Schistocerca serialis cubense]|uniref:uncharacterized protein CG43867 n=1 Tax=Schistocerca serialis cubense TaxID=2023355 RepID=UPI00214DFEBD|nr:uncharacterized protein CG43867 [Schistocerca serialis cubense]